MGAIPHLDIHTSHPQLILRLLKGSPHLLVGGSQPQDGWKQLNEALILHQALRELACVRQSQLDPEQNIPDYKVSNVKSKQKLSSAIIYLTPAVQLAYTSTTRNARNELSLLK